MKSASALGLDWIKQRFKSKPEFLEANTRALKAGYNFGETTETLRTRYRVRSIPRGV